VLSSINKHDLLNKIIFFLLVSHTTFDLVFKWNITDPLVTNPDIELPQVIILRKCYYYFSSAGIVSNLSNLFEKQLDIAKNTTEDCTLEYSTGILFLFVPLFLTLSQRFPKLNKFF